MFGRATITLGIGPHSSLLLKCTDYVDAVAKTLPGQLTQLHVLLAHASCY